MGRGMGDDWGEESTMSQRPDLRSSVSRSGAAACRGAGAGVERVHGWTQVPASGRGRPAGI